MQNILPLGTILNYNPINNYYFLALIDKCIGEKLWSES